MSQIGTKFNLANRFIFDPNSNSLVDLNNESDVIRLGSNESRILLLLAEKPNEVVTRNELHDFVWREQGFEVDDSSLTQAISTLRKMLHDSTRSPEFVKTVPKRGYQLICLVEQTNELQDTTPSAPPSISSISEHLEETPTSQNAPSSVDETAVSMPQVESINSTDIELSKPTYETQPETEKFSWLSKTLLVLAVLLPVCVLLFSQPSQSTFRDIAVYHDVPVKTPISHPSLQNWLGSIERCINQYNERSHINGVAPEEIIATGGQNNQLVLNYIYPLNHSENNVTLRIFTDESGLNRVCQ
ncbi:winged helix-turn-helix domain-containing protein [Vibrio olivae]|uniref:Transcriptional regulator n=1 Tax=Vibrio olivae TaxID=1243002 RepID=A0ABV5HII9_9VIBR